MCAVEEVELRELSLCLRGGLCCQGTGCDLQEVVTLWGVQWSHDQNHHQPYEMVVLEDPVESLCKLIEEERC